MTDLSPGTRHILTAGVRALEPSQAVRDRIRAGVAARIAVVPGSGGAGEGGPAGGASASGATGGGTILKASLLAVIGAVVVGGGALWFGRGEHAPESPAKAAEAPAVAAPAVRESSEPVQSPPAEPVAPVEKPAAGPAPARVAAQRAGQAERRRDGAAVSPERADSVSDDLAREVRLLDDARRALAGGDPDGAREALARHRHEIAAPQMEREAFLLRAEAQCAAADTDDGQRTLAEIDRRWPGASGVDAVRALCRER